MLYVIRHLQVILPSELNGQVVCYGHTDLPAQTLTDSLRKSIFQSLPFSLNESPANVLYVTSPLLRCRQLAGELFEGVPIQQEPRLKELNFGDWEMQPWSEICRASLDDWARSPQSYVMPKGESFELMIKRVGLWLDDLVHQIEQNHYEHVVVITHAGVAKALQFIMKTKSLEEVLQSSLDYGQVLTLPLTPSAQF